MTYERASEHASTAKSLRAKREFGDAGEYFTLAAYEQLGDSPSKRFGMIVSRGLYYLLHGTVCCALARLTDLSRIRCEQGTLIAADIENRLRRKPRPANEYDQSRIGVWDEFTSDFLVIAGDRDGAAEAYDSARSTYEVAADFDLGFAEQEHMDAIRFYEDLRGACGEDMEGWYDVKADLTFPEWIDHKREHLPDYYDAVVEADEWK